MVQDVTARTGTAINTDHALVTADIRIKLRSQKRDLKNPTTRYRKPDERQHHTYNASIVTQYEQYCDAYPNEDKMTNLAWAIKAAAEMHLTKINEKQNYEYISEETLQKIQAREKNRQQCNAEKEQELNKEIKKGARKDKMKWRTNMLEQWSDPRSNWKHIKREKQ